MKKKTPVRENNPESPLVPGAPVRLLSRIPASRLITDWKNFLGIDIAGLLGGIPEILLYRCQASQVDFFLPPEAAGTPELYEELRKFDWYYMADKWEFDQALQDLKGSRRILEVGSGPGLFVEKVLREGKASLIRGLELSTVALQEAHRKNLPVEQENLEGVVAQGETFDAVCSFQVLEHVPQPRPLLESMVKILSPEGKLILCVPNKDGYLKHEYNLLNLPPHHMTRWNAFTFKFLEGLFPLKLRSIRCEPLAHYHISSYVGAYAQYWATRFPRFANLFSEPNLRRLAKFLEKRGLHRYLRGHSLYVLFEKQGLD
jgi:SAM-dependent methyltransferase